MAPRNGLSDRGPDGFIVPTDSMHASPEGAQGRRQAEETSNRSDRRSDKPTTTPDGAALSDESLLDSPPMSPAVAEAPRGQGGGGGAPPPSKADAPNDWWRCGNGEGETRHSGRSWCPFRLPSGGSACCFNRSKDRRRRLLYWGCLVLFLLLLVFIPIFLCVIAPLIVRSVVSSSRFVVKSTDIGNVFPSAFQIQIVIRLLTPPPVGARVGATRATAEWQGRQIGSLDLPEMHLSRRSADVAFSTAFQVQDMDAWGQLSGELLRTGKVDWTIGGLTDIRAMGMTFKDIPFSMNIDVQGERHPKPEYNHLMCSFSLLVMKESVVFLLSLSGPALMAKQREGVSPFRVLSLDFGDSDAQTVRMATTVAFTNDSPTAVSSLGDVEFEMSYMGIPIGRMRSLSPLRMNRGENIYSFKGELRPPDGAPRRALAEATASDSNDDDDDNNSSDQQQQIDQAFSGAIGAMMARSLSGLPIEMDARGVYCSEPIFTPAVLASAFTTPVQGLSVAPREGSFAKQGRSGDPSLARRAPRPRGASPMTSMVEALRFSDMQIREDPNEKDKVLVDAQLKARIANPLGHKSPVNINEVGSNQHTNAYPLSCPFYSVLLPFLNISALSVCRVCCLCFSWPSWRICT